MSIRKVLGVMVTGLVLQAGALCADPASDLLRLNAQRENPTVAVSQPLEEKIAQEILKSPEGMQDFRAMVQGLDEQVAKRVLAKIQFEAAHQNRSDMQNSLLEISMALATRAPLSSENMLGIPLRPGKLVLSFMFIKKNGAIVRCDRERFQATLDTLTLDVVADPNVPGRVIATFGGTAPDNVQLPKEPVGGKIVSNGTSASIIGEDGSTMEVTYKGNGTYKFSSNKLPVSVSARYVD